MNFQVTSFNRTTLLYFLENLSPKQLFTIPKGFKNNIIWNLGHLLITEQMLTYGLSGLDLSVDKQFVKMYGKGSFPSTEVSKEAIADIKTQLIPAVKQTKIDYENGVFENYNEYETSAGVVLKSIGDAMRFNMFHEGIHIGIILSLKKIV
ncbi:MAG: DinB family protein [Flavobacteriaceae bacterium]|nr:DinB family protein [Flavobacteriaceae bacterium]